MLSVDRLGHVAIRVEDVERAVTFYQGLGMRLVWKADDWCYLETEKGRYGLALLGPKYKAAGPHFAFHFRDRAEVDAVHDRLMAQGAHVGRVHDHRDGTASFYLKDSEGNWLEMLYEPPGGIPSNCS
ncbi:VOC family protein [Synechococcus sp. M16CYN]|uniref:VOC family protein n=1 Tax=Synechococcus sp. M16CYN TaxID=3103139 RepID=UPI0030E365DC